MKTFKHFVALAAVLAALCNSTIAATNGVVVGMDPQAAINAAAAGDTLFMEPGPYTNAAIVIDKPLTFIAAAGPTGGQIQFMGTVKVQGAGATHFQQSFFNQPVNTVGASVTFIDTFFNSTVGTSGGKLTVKRTTFNAAVTMTNTSLEALRMTLLAPLTGGTNNPNANAQAIVVQSSFSQTISLTGYKVWFGYNSSHTSGSVSLLRCDSVFIGNSLYSGATVLTADDGTIKGYNNLFRTQSGGHGVLLLRTLAGEFVNNTIWVLPSHAGLHPIVAQQLRGPLTLRGNILTVVTGVSTLINVDAESAPYVTARYCTMWNGGPDRPMVNHGLVQLVNCQLNTDPQFNPDFTLAPESPCLNQGVPDVVAQNRSPAGTRNTIGHLGGPFFNPANYTNDNPMVFLLTGPQTILKGSISSIPISVAGAAGQ